jgi:WD40 repeat protein
MDSANTSDGEKALFEQALELTSTAERRAFLKGACAEDAALIGRIEALLKAHEATEGFLPGKPTGRTTLLSVHEKPGDQVGRYKLREKIGEGGCGVVYVAEQEEPVRRRVALKVIKLGMDTRQVVARFEAERQALALMDHPNIAKVLDAGATETGRPYFVMELVRGIKITDYCDQNNLATRERLDLFVQVCRAVQHAHQKGIIHRDLKPSNILVTLHDGVPVPKVIDFGIAKATEGRLTDLTVYTELNQFLGTPAYMSPEQAEMSGLDIDTRSDIYSLGVLLYELLTGKTPFDPKELLEAGLDEIRRTIREREPVRPSTRLSTMLAAELTTTAKRRASEAPKLIHLLRGDLDWIVMKALEKDRTRRYETANALAMDIHRFQGNEPVVARPPSGMYRLQKLARRNKVAFAAASAVLLALVVGSGLATIGFVQARAQRDYAIAAGRVAQDQASRAETEALANRQNLYAAQMNLANLALETHNLGRLRDLLERYAPKEGQSSKSERDLRGWEWRYLKGHCHSDDIGILGRYKRQVSSVCFSPDGHLLAAAADDGLVHLWDFNTRTELPPFETFPANLDQTRTDINHAVAFSPDGRRLAAGGPNREIRIWDLATREQFAALTGHAGNIKSVAFSPDGKLLASAADDGTALLWDVASQRPRQVAMVGGSKNAAYCVAFSRDGNTLVVSWLMEPVKLYNISKPESPQLLPEALGTLWWWSVDFSPDGKLLALAGQNNHAVHVYEFPSLRRLRTLWGHAGILYHVAFSPDGRRLASAGSDGNICLRTLDDPDQTVTLMGHDDQVMTVAFSPDGKTLASGSADGTVRLWNATTNSQPQSLFYVDNWVYHVAFSPDSKYAAVLSAANSSALTLWDVAAGREIDHADFPTADPSQVSFSPDSKAVCASSHGQTSFYRVPSLQWITNEVADRFIFAHDGSFAIVIRDGNIMRRDLATGAETVLGFQSGGLWSVVLSPDGRTLALVAAFSKTISLWNTAEPGQPAYLNGHTLPVDGVAFSPDGKLLASSSWDGSVLLRDVAARRSLMSLRGHTGNTQDVAFSPDGRTLASCADDSTVKLWNLASLQEATTLHGHRGPVSAIAFSPDGKHLASAGGWAVRFWHAPTFAEIAAADEEEADRKRRR